MLKENETFFDLLNITQYHADCRTGQNRHVVVLDSITQSNHQGQLIREGAEIAPHCKSTYLPRNRMKDSVDWIFEHKDEIHAINCSWHSGINKEFERLEALDIPVLAASGNQNKERINYPGSLSWVISVGAWNPIKQRVEGYSNTGEGIDCVAPIIYWMKANGTGAMKNVGTSFAVIVATYMLQLAEVNGRQAAFDFIRNCSQDKLIPGYDTETGHGLFVLPKLGEGGENMPGFEGPASVEVRKGGVKTVIPAGLLYGRTQVELRTIAEAINGKLSWDALNKTAILTLPD